MQHSLVQRNNRAACDIFATLSFGAVQQAYWRGIGVSLVLASLKKSETMRRKILTLGAHHAPNDVRQPRTVRPVAGLRSQESMKGESAMSIIAEGFENQLIGRKFKTRGKHPRECTIIDVLRTYNSANELVQVRYIATHMLGAQTITDRDVCTATISMGLLPAN
jgi:hypothetical protein